MGPPAPRRRGVPALLRRLGLALLLAAAAPATPTPTAGAGGGAATPDQHIVRFSSYAPWRAHAARLAACVRAANGSHAVVPRAVWCLPTSQLEQLVRPPSAACDPGLHAVGATDPTEHMCPGRQSAHAVLPASP